MSTSQAVAGKNTFNKCLVVITTKIHRKKLPLDVKNTYDDAGNFDIEMKLFKVYFQK